MKPKRILSCQETIGLLSTYLDGAVSGREMQAIEAHLQECSACARELQLAVCLQKTLSSLGPVRAPGDLALKMQVALSREQAYSWRRRWDRLALAWSNTLRPLTLQLAGGFAAAIFLVGTILSLLGAVGSSPVLANDEPLGAITAPHYLYSVAGIQPIETPHDETLVVEAMINAQGRVYDFRILSGPQDAPVQKQVSNRLLTSVFAPASVFGVPVRGHLLLTYSGISVRG